MGYFRDRAEKRKRKEELAAVRAENEIAQLKYDTAYRNTRMEAVIAAHKSIRQVTNSGYSHGGASRNATWSKKYYSESLSHKSDIEENRKLLRERTRDLAMNDSLAASAVNATRTNVIGSGLIPKPKIDHEFLGMSQQEAVKLQNRIKKEFALWAESTMCDACDQNNFYELQQIAMLDWLKNGEEFCLLKYEKPTAYMPYSLRLKLLEADRICTEGSLSGDYIADRKLKNGNTVMNGVEIDSDGKVIAYHICSGFPGEYSGTNYKWQRVEKRGKRTGDLQILHIFNAERAEQYRGVPFLAPVIQTIKQISRYTEAEIMAAIVNSMLALFVRTEGEADIGGFGGIESDEEPNDTGREFLLGSGTVNFLNQGEDIVPVESKHPGGNYSSFVESMASQIGAALEIAPEVMLKKFQNNFSASKGAMNETWKAFKARRKWFVNDFCQEVYNLWFAEAVATGRINAPGFFADPLIRKAYTNATWNGPTQGQLDPVKEVNAAVIRIDNGLSTREDESAMMNGSDFEDNVRALEHENEILANIQANKEVKDEDTDKRNDS